MSDKVFNVEIKLEPNNEYPEIGVSGIYLQHKLKEEVDNSIMQSSTLVSKDLIHNINKLEGNNNMNKPDIKKENCKLFYEEDLEEDGNVSDEITFCCDICKATYQNEIDMNAHIKRHMSSLKGNTGKKFKKKPRERSSGDRIKHECYICITQYATKRNYTKHMEKHQPYTCDFCKMRLFKRSILISHIKAHTNKPFPCKLCPKAFNLKSDLDTHVQMACPKIMLPCNVCKDSFNNRITLKNHMNSHEEDRPYSCNACLYRYSTEKALNGHRCRVKRSRTVCSICDKSFSYVNNLKRHIDTVHRKMKAHKCTVCDRLFSRNTHLVKHTRVHIKVETPPNHDCRVCKKSFSSPSNLRAHERRHVNYKPFTCDICKRCFVNKSNMVYHIMGHIGIMPYSCDLCNVTFRRKGQLTKHKLRHADESKPYCSKSRKFEWQGCPVQSQLCSQSQYS